MFYFKMIISNEEMSLFSLEICAHLLYKSIEKQHDETRGLVMASKEQEGFQFLSSCPLQLVKVCVDTCRCEGVLLHLSHLCYRGALSSQEAR